MPVRRAHRRRRPRRHRQWRPRPRRPRWRPHRCATRCSMPWARCWPGRARPSGRRWWRRWAP
ncbi:MAG: hypothetical protein FGM58_08440 [Acidimicrobiia bacterium]|nr:hypothetical protein [Acidimicrobiia bacterium]